MLDGAEREVAAEHELGCVGSDSGTMEGDGTAAAEARHSSSGARQQRRRQRRKSASTAIATAATVAAANMETHSSDGSVGSGGNEAEGDSSNSDSSVAAIRDQYLSKRALLPRGRYPTVFSLLASSRHRPSIFYDAPVVRYPRRRGFFVL